MNSESDEKPTVSGNASTEFLEPTAADNVSVEGDNDFYFESDHLALRGNRDYGNVLRTIAILESQRVLVHKQLEELTIAKKQYLENPELLLEKLKKGEEIIPPNHIKIAELPEIIGNYDEYLPDKVTIKDEPGAGSKVNKVRGRVVDETKSETFNKLWTCEEQQELERLLVEYPAEEVEMRRYSKIAKALGNRTPQQVFSRVQKYFKKLHDAGLPVPGRRPKNRRPGQLKRKLFHRPSTFFPAYNVPVQMPEDDFALDDMGSVPSPAASSHGEEAAAYEIVETSNPPDARQHTLHMLKTIRDEKNKTVEGYNPDPLAPKCEVCLVTPVSNARWYCNSCYCCVNLCHDCLTTQLLEQKFEHLMHDVVHELDT